MYCALAMQTWPHGYPDRCWVLSDINMLVSHQITSIILFRENNTQVQYTFSCKIREGTCMLKSNIPGSKNLFRGFHNIQTSPAYPIPFLCLMFVFFFFSTVGDLCFFVCNCYIFFSIFIYAFEVLVISSFNIFFLSLSH